MEAKFEFPVSHTSQHCERICIELYDLVRRTRDFPFLSLFCPGSCAISIKLHNCLLPLSGCAFKEITVSLIFEQHSGYICR